MKTLTLSCLLLATTLVAQEDKKQQDPKPVDPNAVLAEVLEKFQKEKIKVDAKAGTVSIPAVVNQPQDPIEYLLIHKKGKRHEAVFMTQVTPSILNAALLMIGLEQGKNATYEEKVPAPTLEEVQKGVDPLIVKDPVGKPFWMTVKWTTEEKQTVEYCVEDLVLDLTTRKPLVGTKWVYMGGRMACLYKGDPEVYIADFEGNLISICYLSPDNHLATMAHERARDDQNWWTTNKLAEPGTDVTFVFHKKEPKVHVERRKRIQQASKGRDAKPAKKDDKK